MLDHPVRKLALELVSRLRRRRSRAAVLGDRTFFEDSPSPMWVFDPEDFRFLDVNAAAIQRYGYTREEFLAMTIKDIRPPGEVGKLLAKVGNRARPPRERSGGFRHLSKSGEIIDVEIVSHEIRLLGRRVRLVLANDVTARLRLEEQLCHAQKMDAVGQLAGGVAHDFNNLLTVIAASTTAALEDPSLSAEACASLLDVRRATARATELTRQLLALGRKQALKPRALDVNATIRDAETMFRRLIRNGTVLETSFGSGVGSVYADPVQLEIALLNLVANARDATPDGGRIAVSTRGVLADDALASEVPGVSPGRYVAISVADSGSGMSADVLDHAFDPFFTTKPAGKGTGLGLATVYGIAKQSGGAVQLVSAHGAGTVATLYLPRLAEASGATSERAAS